MKYLLDVRNEKTKWHGFNKSVSYRLSFVTWHWNPQISPDPRAVLIMTLGAGWELRAAAYLEASTLSCRPKRKTFLPRGKCQLKREMWDESELKVRQQKKTLEWMDVRVINEILFNSDHYVFQLLKTELNSFRAVKYMACSGQRWCTESTKHVLVVMFFFFF